MRRNIGSLLLATFAGLTILRAAAAPLSQTSGAWSGSYFANANLEGTPLFTRADAAIDFDWGEGAPDQRLSSDDFSVRWVRWLFTDTPGEWTFIMVNDDGARLYIDDALVIDAWTDAPLTTRAVRLNLTQSFHLVRMEYYDRSAAAQARLYIVSPNFPEWRGEYFDNPSLSGAPAFVRRDTAISFNFGTSGPGEKVGGTNFSTRWTRAHYFDAGRYRFTTRTDDGVRVWVDGQLVLDEWHDAVPQNYSGEIALNQGIHFVKMEYYQKTGGALAILTWTPIATSGENWRGEYFDNPSLSGAPAFVREDADLNFSWGTASPGGGIGRSGNWSARWTARRTSAAGFYTVSVTADDGVRVFVDNRIVIDKWHDQKPTTHAASVFLTAGRHEWRVEFYENTGGAQLRVQIAPGVGSPSSEPLGESIVDDTAPGFFKSRGDWRDLQTGLGNRALATPNRARAAVNWARWYPTLARAGWYEISVHIPANAEATRNASYVIAHNGTTATRRVNQAAYANQWVSLGAFYFVGRGNEYVEVSDVTYEPEDSTLIFVDAVRFRSTGSR